jgi:hypothetical protein
VGKAKKKKNTDFPCLPLKMRFSRELVFSTHRENIPPRKTPRETDLSFEKKLTACRSQIENLINNVSAKVLMT